MLPVNLYEFGCLWVSTCCAIGWLGGSISLDLSIVYVVNASACALIEATMWCVAAVRGNVR